MIKIYNRHLKSYEKENVAGKKYIEWTYQSPTGKKFTEIFIKKKLFSKLYGKYCDLKISSNKIPCFVKDFDIDMSESVKSIKEFNSFNDFFTRKLVACSRPITNNPDLLIAPCDGRLMAHINIDINNLIQVKGFTYSLKELIKNDDIAKKYEGGTCLIFRLAPIDYHRFHFMDSGVPLATNFIKGSYYSVNPIALNNIKKLFCQNKREWCILKSDNFDDILSIEVGATCVGSIIETYTPNIPVKRGDEKGYFKFGGSTIIMFFKKNSVIIDDDILYQSKLGFETKVLFGETIGSKQY